MARQWVWAAALAAASAGIGCKKADIAESVNARAPAAKDYWRQLGPGENALRKITDPAKLPDYREGFADREGLAEAVKRSIKYLAEHPSSLAFFPSNGISHGRVLESLQAFLSVLETTADAETFDRRVKQMFDTYESVGCDNEGTVLFTGYYRPIFDASRVPTAEYRWPLYRKPDDLVVDESGATIGTPRGRRTPEGTVVPYYTRGELETGPHLRNKGLELVWLRDRFDAFIVHVQGSALLKLTDGSWMMVGYKAKTDRPYGSVGDALIKDGRIRKEERSLQRIRRHFRENPADMDKYLPINECFVFFTEASDGPFGSLNVKVTPLRSLATDKAIYPRAAVTFAKTKLPGRGGVGKFPLNRFLLDQDTGGAIRAPGRADLFLGTGPEAEAVAGATYDEGRLYYLFLKDEYAGTAAPRPPARPTASRR